MEMKCFNQEKWNLLSRDLKVSVACRYCYLPYFSNLVVQLGLSKTDVHFALEHLTNLGKLEEKWERVSAGWALCFYYNDRHDNDFIDQLIEEML
jgi:hypothetical protein